MSGWIKIHRDIAKHWISQDMEKLGRWLDLLILASFEDNKVLVGDRLIEVNRGQMIASCDFLARRWGCSKSTVAKFLELLESDNMVERCIERKITKLTICNYDSYQQKEEGTPNDVSNDCRTIAERLPNELKKVEEVKEYNNYNSNACTREEKTSWNAQREQGFLNTFIGTGVGISIARATGKSANEISRLLEVFMAECQVKDNGHKDSNDFNTHFLNCIKGGFIALPAMEQPKKKVISGQAIFDLL